MVERAANTLEKHLAEREKVNEMSVCITASHIMPAGEVSKKCRELMENESLILVLEMSIKQQYMKAKKEKILPV